MAVESKYVFLNSKDGVFFYRFGVGLVAAWREDMLIPLSSFDIYEKLEIPLGESLPNPWDEIVNPPVIKTEIVKLGKLHDLLIEIENG